VRDKASRKNQTCQKRGDLMPLHARRPHGRSVPLRRTFLRCSGRSWRQCRAKHRFHRFEPSGHALAQEQGKPNATWLACNHISPSGVPRRVDNLGAKQLVLSGVLHEVELGGFDDQRRFFSSCRRYGRSRRRILRGCASTPQRRTRSAANSSPLSIRPAFSIASSRTAMASSLSL
jgi:hypothetical protein